MLPFLSTAICGLTEPAALLETITGVGTGTAANPSAERVKKTPRLFRASSSQTTLMLPWASTAMRGLKEEPKPLERFVGVENVAPPSVERLNRIFAVAVSSSQTT